MRIVFLKSTYFPTRQSTGRLRKTCSRILNTSGCAFRFHPAAQPNKERALRARSAGRPLHSPHIPEASQSASRRNALHELRHVEADQSFFRSEHELSQGARDSDLPTAVGPRKRNEPIGRFGLFNPARERRIARASALIDLSCEMIRLCNSSSMRSDFCVSSSLIEVMGTPVQRETTSSISSRPTTPVEDSSR